MDDSLLHYGLPTSSSRDLEAPCFKWSKEVPRASQPYIDKQLHLPHNPGPNEVNFMGGLGHTRGLRKSKVHPLPNTTVQTIFHMKTSNKFLKTLTEDPNDVHCRPSTAMQSKKRLQLHEILEKLELADNMDSPLASEVSDPAPDQFSVQPTNSSTNDVKPVALDQKPQSNKRNSASAPQMLSLKERIIQERIRYKAKLLQVTNDSNNPKMARQVVELHTTASPTAQHRKTVKNLKSASRFVHGYQFGPFATTPVPDKNMKTVNKFGVPNSMLARFKAKEKKHRLLQKTARNARKIHVGMPMLPTSAPSTSKLGALVEEVRRLTLLRTPYFCVPMLRSKHNKQERDVVKRERQQRINMFFSKMSAIGRVKREQQNEESTETVTRQRTEAATTHIEEATTEDRNFQHYSRFIDQQYADRKQVYDERLSNKMMTFDEFKGLEDTLPTSKVENQTRRIEVKTKVAEKNSNDLQPLAANVGQQKRRKPHLARSDELVGQLYIAPEVQKPTIDHYFGLMRSVAGVRNRLQVNTTSFEQERLGYRNSYFHRLCTEFDNYYVQELRVSRPRVRNFLPKSDMAKIRHTLKRKFARYYIQEHLLLMQEKQLMDARQIAEIEKAATCCEPVLVRGQREAYEKFDKKFVEMKMSNVVTGKLQQKFNSIKESWELLNEKILRVETQWNNLIVCSNYYLELTGSKTTKENLISTMIRPKTDENLLDFFNQQIFPRIQTMSKITPDKQSFNNGVDALRKKVNGLITQNLEFVWLNARFQLRFDDLRKTLPKIQLKLENLIKFQREKVKLLQERNATLKTEATRMINGKLLRDTIKNPPLRKIKNVCQQIRKITAAKMGPHCQPEVKVPQKVSEFSVIQNNVLMILELLDNIPISIVKSSEHYVRQQHKLRKVAAKKAYQQNQSFQLLKRQLQHHCHLTQNMKH